MSLSNLFSSCSVPHFITNISCLFNIYNTNSPNKTHRPHSEYTFIAVIHSIYVKCFSLTPIGVFCTPLFKGVFFIFLIVQNISVSLIAIDVCNPFSVAVNRFLYDLSFWKGLFIIFFIIFLCCIILYLSFIHSIFSVMCSFFLIISLFRPNFGWISSIICIIFLLFD